MVLNINVMNKELSSKEAMSIINCDVFKKISLYAIVHDEENDEKSIYKVGYDEESGIFGVCLTGEYDEDAYPDIETILYCADTIAINEMIYK